MNFRRKWHRFFEEATNRSRVILIAIFVGIALLAFGIEAAASTF